MGNWKSGVRSRQLECLLFRIFGKVCLGACLIYPDPGWYSGYIVSHAQIDPPISPRLPERIPLLVDPELLEGDVYSWEFISQYEVLLQGL